MEARERDGSLGQKSMKIRILLLGLFVCFVPSIAPAQKLDISYDRKVDFKAYRTYSWGKGTDAPNPMTHQRIIEDVDAQLAAKGLQKVDSNPDLVVIYNVSVNAETSISTYSIGGPYNGYQYNWTTLGGNYMSGTIGAGDPQAVVQTIQVGELVVDLIDVKLKHFVWRGAASETLKDRDTMKIRKKVDKAVAKMFKSYPPKPGFQY